MHPDIERNHAATARLRELLGRLSEHDLVAPLGGGWTVAVALAHLAFWDRRQAAALRLASQTGDVASDDRADTLVNEALEPLLVALEPRAAARQALEAAAAVDTAAAALDTPLCERLLQTEHAYLLRRWAHREEHIAQIERALSS